MKTLTHSIPIKNGHSLVELLIAMTLGIFLINGAFQLFVSARVTQSEMMARQRMLEGARLVISFIGDELRMAGYLGCFGSLGERRINSVLNAPPESFQPWFGLQGWESTGTAFKEPISPSTAIALVRTDTSEWRTLEAGHVLPRFDALPNSDIIRTWNVEGTPAEITEVNQNPPSFRLRNSPDIERNDFVLVSDCARAEIVQACSLTQQTDSTLLGVSTTCKPGNKSGVRLVTGASADAPAEAMRIQSNLFYVGKRGGEALNSPALFRRSLGVDGYPDAAEELVEGVENLQFLYGVSLGNESANSVNAYLTADEVSDFSKVVSVRVELLMQSVDYSQSVASHYYVFNGVRYSLDSLPADRRMRQGFSATFYLRNRGLGL
jgi:type IV pilus assembly protein PilW